MLKDLNIGAVVDLTPGSGTLARACLEAQKPYAGVCKSEHHTGWLANLLDRQVACLLCTPGSSLYNADIATKLRGNFASTVDHLIKTAAAEQHDEDDDDECDDDDPPCA